MKKALIAMSGGVDSSVAAYLMKENGFDCVGAIMQLRENSCCTEQDVIDANEIAKSLSMPFHIFNFKQDFQKQVVDRFISAYEKGYTPNPCIDCNRYIKFARFHQMAKELGCDYIVTGHYARITEENGKFYLKKAVDESKDQSYVLYSLTQEQLAHTKFPLGEFNKSYARQIAEEQGFINSRKKDSQDICFVPDGDYAKVIEEITGKTYPVGDFVDKKGNVLGKHNGIIRYTIGQRKGLGLSLPAPMYVCQKDLEKNTVVLCSNEELFSKELYAEDFNWISGEVPTGEIRIKAKIRYNQVEQPATAVALGQDRVHIIFDQPQRAIAKGQSAVLYDGDTVVGGGVII